MKLTIEVIPRTKKNSQNIVMIKGRPIIIPSKYYKQYEKECNLLIPAKYRQKIDVPINIKAIFYVDNRRKIDLTNLLEGLDDVLVTCGVIKDDNRDIIGGHDGSRVYYDKERPRVEIEITKLEDYERWKKN